MNSELLGALVKIASAGFVFGCSASLTVRTWRRSKVALAKEEARIQLAKTQVKTKVFSGLVDEFRKEVSRLDVINQTHASKLTDTIATCAELSGELHGVLRDLDIIKHQSPELRDKMGMLEGQVSILIGQFTSAQKRLREKPIAGSGGLNKLEGEKKG